MLKSFKLIVSLTLIGLLLSSCSGSSNESDKSSSKKDTDKSVELFAEKVEAICSSVDEKVVLSLSLISSGATTDPGEMAESLKTTEDEMDKFIAKLELVEPPAKFEDDWDSYLGENAEIRDTFPELAEILIKVSSANQKIIDDPANQIDLMNEVEELFEDIELILRELELRVNEIEILTKDMKIDDCANTIE